MQDRTCNALRPPSQEPVVDWEEIFLMLWRQRGKIAGFGLTGLLLGVLFVLSSSTYESGAKVFVRYVQENSAVDVIDRNVMDGDTQRARVLNNEIEILTSADLAEDVAMAVGPETIASSAQHSDRLAWLKERVGVQAKKQIPDAALTPEVAARLISKGLVIIPKKDSSVIQISYRNPEPQLTERVLEELVRRYFDKHLEIHRPGKSQFVQEQTAQSENRLREIDDEINQAMKEAGIVSTADCLEQAERQRSLMRSDLFVLEAELAGAQARAKSLEPLLTVGNQEDRGAGVLLASAEPKPSQRDISRYQALLDLVELLRKRNLEIISKFTPGSRLVAENSQQLDAAESERRALATKFPELVGQTSLTRNATNNSAVPRVDIDVELANVSALQAKRAILAENLTSYDKYASALPDSIFRIRNLERQRQQEEDSLAHLRATLKKVEVDAALDPAAMPNLSVLQHPTPPEKVRPSLAKFGGLALIAGLGLGLVLAFWVEMVVDRRVKRPEQFAKNLGIPLSLTVPFVSGLKGWRGTLELGRYARNVVDMLAHEWLCRGAPPGPQLVAISGAGRGTGASTLTACLAEALRVQGAKVLVVNSDSLQNDPVLCEAEEHGEGRPACWKSLSLKQFGLFVSKLLQTDYDYVLFDMPLVGPGIPTLSIVKSLHKVLLITSPDRTDCALLVHMYDALITAGADITCIFNKVPPANCNAPLVRYMPPRLSLTHAGAGGSMS